LGMTESEWLAATNPTQMLQILRDRRDCRKLRLYTCACCRHIWFLLTDDRSRGAIEAAEGFSDGFVTDEQREAAFSSACDASLDIGLGREIWSETSLQFRRQQPSEMRWRAAVLAAFAVGTGAGHAPNHIGGAELDPVDGEVQARILRDIFGNPFRPVAVHPPWLTSTVVTLAETIYGDRAFDRLPILADALQDAGCEDGQVLGHCRGPGPHVRGCWVVDLATGRG
jgi:hypothetical protein